MQLNPNPNSVRFMQAFHFFHLLSQLNRRRPSTPLPSRTAAARRTRGIRRAAYTSLAFAVWPQRPWSRALLRSLRSTRDRRRATRTLGSEQRRRGSSRRADELRQLLPGGKSMDLCCLLEETANYIESLEFQVKVMQKIADSFVPCGKKDAGDDGKKEKK